MHDLPLTEPVAVFTVVLGVLLAAPLVARRGVPSAVVLLGAGVALGPHALGVLDRDPTMVLLGTVGLLYIMFLAGLEIDLHELSEGRARSLTVGAATFALPLAAGVALGRAALEMEWMASVLLGSVLASHTLLAYPTAARLGLQRERATTAAVGATILTDTLALLVLAVVATAARAGGALDVAVLVQVVGSLAVVGAVVLWGLPRLGAWFLKTAAQDATVEFVFVLAAVFACALAVEALGVEPIIGAFLAGLGLNRLVPPGSALLGRIGFVGDALFIPFFLLSTGMLVDAAAFAGGPDVGRAWVIAAGMTGTLLVTKASAAAVTRPAFGFSSDEARLVFGLTVPQAAATLAAVLVGVEVGLFDGAVLNGTIAMVAVTCVVGPVVVERAGRRLARAAGRRAGPGAGGRVVVSLSNPATADALLGLAARLRPAGGPPVVAVTVTPPTDGPAGVERAERLLDGVAARAADVRPVVRVEANVARALARTATETRADVVVVGWDGSAAAERALFGTVPDRVLHETSAAVVVAHGAGAAVRRWVVAVPSEAAAEPGVGDAARLVAGFAERGGASVAVLAADPAAAAPFRAAPIGPLPDSPDALADWLGAHGRPGDGLVLVSARRSGVAWEAVGRGPREVVRRRPGLPLLVVCPGRPAAPATPLADAVA